MDTKTLFENFHKKNREEITELIRKFAELDFFTVFPELKNEVSVLITGSVASGYQDKNSDVDFTIFFQNRDTLGKYKPLIIKDFKGQNGKSQKAPIELHGGNLRLLEDVENELKTWSKDWLLREVADAMVAYDPNGDIEKMRQKYAWYPDEIFKEKMNWLFAESTFLIFDRYETGVKRGSLYYTESIKLNILRLFMICLILLNGRYPKSDKHLQRDIDGLEGISPEIKQRLADILREKESEKIFNLLILLRKEIEKLLLERKIISKEDNDFWLGLRPAYKVELEK